METVRSLILQNCDFRLSKILVFLKFLAKVYSSPDFQGFRNVSKSISDFSHLDRVAK